MTTILTTSNAYKAARKVLGDYRKAFDSVEDAVKALKNIYATESFPDSFPILAAGVGLIDISGEDTIPPLTEWPAEFSAPGIQIAVSFLGVRGQKGDDDKKTNGARAFVLYPLHSVDAIQADDSGDSWLLKIIEKEMSHVAFRDLRNVAPALGNDGLEAAAKAMPLSVSDYVESSTREGLDTEAFDALWKQFRKMLAEQPSTAPIAAELPTKPEVVKAIRSKAFAVENYEKLESHGVFVFIADTIAKLIDRMRAAAIESGEDFDLDSSEIVSWLKGRDTKVFAAPRKVEADLSNVDLAAFAASLQLTPNGSATAGGQTE